MIIEFAYQITGADWLVWITTQIWSCSRTHLKLLPPKLLSLESWVLIAHLGLLWSGQLSLEGEAATSLSWPLSRQAASLLPILQPRKYWNLSQGQTLCSQDTVWHWEWVNNAAASCTRLSWWINQTRKPYWAVPAIGYLFLSGIRQNYNLSETLMSNFHS